MAEASSTPTNTADGEARARLMARRERLTAIPHLSRRPDYRDLLRQVDSALERLESGTYGRCEECDCQGQPAINWDARMCHFDYPLGKKRLQLECNSGN